MVLTNRHIETKRAPTRLLLLPLPRKPLLIRPLPLHSLMRALVQLTLERLPLLFRVRGVPSPAAGYTSRSEVPIAGRRRELTT